MECLFWKGSLAVTEWAKKLGVEVKAGQPLKVKPTFDNIIHLSQASLGESKKDKGHESVPLFVKFGDQKLVLGTLISDTIPQLSFDLVFEKEFEISHNWKNGSVYFCGYQTPLPQDSSDEFDMDGSDEDEEEDIPMIAAENGKGGLKVEKAKAPVKANAGKPEISVKPSKATIKPEENDDSDSDDSMDDGVEDDSDEISDDEEGSDEDEDDSEDEDSDEDEETPKKAVAGKKRPTESATKTPVPAKKAKAPATPQTDGKKGVHVATPHPSKQAGKTPNDKTPKSGGGQFSCKSCSKSFGSDGALQSHNKAKHSASK
ncbi:hypothetical protein Patl1_30498 [Pistacia atlantica]|uniref:Uncharacterized protein n=1 Tax=Pistacia atlantica TaxID=434234 RepID=A0ACC1AA79_9ROSI|nr:hypothetical protein Patl1_30498 [Pistacia atlantica]